MKNPFKFGEAVTGEWFANRRREIEEIKGMIDATQNIFIYSYRRLGKTSLIKTVLDSLSDRAYVKVYMDVHRASSLAQFVEEYSHSITQSFLSRKDKFKIIRSFFSRITPSFELTESGSWKVTFDFSKTTKGVERALEEVYELPQIIAERYNKKVVVVFDEFQEIEQFNGISFERKLRSFIQHHNKVCYIFMGSKTHIILNMFSNPERSFYQSARLYPIPLIPKDELTNFIIERFQSTSKSISKEIAVKIVSTGRGSPYHIQLLSYMIWANSKRRVSEKDIQLAIDEIMVMQNELFFSWFDSCSLNQRAVLRVLALSETNKIFSQDVRLIYNLGSSSTVQASIKALLNNNIIIKSEKGHRIFDPFFEIWLKRNS